MGGLIRGYKKHLTVPHPGWQRTDPLDRGLVAEWRFDPVSGLLLPDYSGRGYHGTVIGADWITSQYGPALDFVDANVDYVNTNYQRFGGTGLFAAATETFTVEIFCKVPVDPGGYLVGKTEGGNRTFAFFYSAIAARSPRISIRGQISDTAAGTDDGQWHVHHVTWDATTCRYLIDGSFHQNLNVGANAEAARNLYFASEDGGINTMDCTIASVRIWDRALSASEVLAGNERCLKRADPMASAWMMPWGAVTAVPRIPRHPAAYNTLAIY